MRRFYFPDPGGLVLTDVLHALSDPTRLRVVAALADGGEQSCCAESLVPKSTLSHHLKVLRQTGVITSRAEGTQLFNSLRRADLDARFPGLLDAVLRSLPTPPSAAPAPSPPD